MLESDATSQCVQLERRFGLVYRRHGYLSPVATRLADILRAQEKDLLRI